MAVEARDGYDVVTDVGELAERVRAIGARVDQQGPSGVALERGLLRDEARGGCVREVEVVARARAPASAGTSTIVVWAQKSSWPEPA